MKYVKYTEFYNYSYRQGYVKFKDFQGLLKAFPTVFKDYKLMDNND